MDSVSYLEYLRMYLYVTLISNCVSQAETQGHQYSIDLVSSNPKGRIKLKVKDIDDEDESGSGFSNTAAIDAFDSPGNNSTTEESQCCEM